MACSEGFRIGVEAKIAKVGLEKPESLGRADHVSNIFSGISMGVALMRSDRS